MKHRPSVLPEVTPLAQLRGGQTKKRSQEGIRLSQIHSRTLRNAAAES
jgi:hypothetical protein